VKKRNLGFAGWLILGVIAAAAYVTFAEQAPIRKTNAWIMSDAEIAAPIEDPQGGRTA
jgi:hypothetical protein